MVRFFPWAAVVSGDGESRNEQGSKGEKSRLSAGKSEFLDVVYAFIAGRSRGMTHSFDVGERVLDLKTQMPIGFKRSAESNLAQRCGVNA
jgi:hypothetical protein